LVDEIINESKQGNQKSADAGHGLNGSIHDVFGHNDLNTTNNGTGLVSDGHVDTHINHIEPNGHAFQGEAAKKHNEDTEIEHVRKEVSRIFEEGEKPVESFEYEHLDTKVEGVVEPPVVVEAVSPPTPPVEKKEVIVSKKLVETPPYSVLDVKMTAEVDRALQAIELGRSADGFRIFAGLVESNPQNSNLRYQYSALLAQHGQINEASQQLEVLLSFDKHNVEAYLMRAYLAEQHKDYLLSQAMLEKVAEMNPDYPGIYFKLGVITNNHFKGQRKKAAKYFKLAFKHDPHNADAHYLYAMNKLEYSGDYDKALQHLNKTLEINPAHPKANFDMAVAFYEQGKKADAAKHYLIAGGVNPIYKTAINDEIFQYEAPKVVEKAVPINDNGLVVMITGASSGIGRATAEVFAQHGYRLLLTGRRGEKLEEAKAFLKSTYHNLVETLIFDVRSVMEVRAAVGNLKEEWRNVDVLINNAGLASGLSPIHEGEIEDWDNMIDTNIKGLLYMTRAVAPGMVARRKGHILNICSTAGKEVYPNGNVYSATKHAVDALTRAMRLDLFKHNIRVSQVSPGMVEETEFALVRFHGDAEKAKIYDDIQPLKAKDVAETIFFVVSRSEYINIQDVLMMGTQQASSNHLDRSGRG
jgi:NADP-dependent 3-hydroxy acid dehydrogenase YdfG/Flp pilus assembly protein TadD